MAENELKKLESEIMGEREVVICSKNSSKDIADSLAGCVQFALQSVYFAKLRLDYQRTGRVPRIK